MTTRKFEDEYALGDILGTGNCSVVCVATHKATDLKCAVKIIDKTSLSNKLRDRLSTEIDLLSKVSHPLVNRLVDVFDTQYKLWLVLELKEGGDLFDRISKREFSEPEAAFALSQIGYGVQYLHSRGIVHRDLKPENILFTNHREDSTLCIADFGFAKELSEANGMVSTPCGTIPYLAPEVFNAELYSKGVDLWAMGVIMYTMLCGYPPFHHDDDEELMKIVVKGTFEFPSDPWDNISEDAKNLIRNLLQMDTSKRYTIEEFLRDPWIVKNLNKIKGSETPKSRSKELSSDNLKKFLNHLIEVQRYEETNVGLKSASESSLWKRRQNRSQVLTKSQ